MTTFLVLALALAPVLRVATTAPRRRFRLPRRLQPWHICRGWTSRPSCSVRVLTSTRRGPCLRQQHRLEEADLHEVLAVVASLLGLAYRHHPLRRSARSLPFRTCMARRSMLEGRSSWTMSGSGTQLGLMHLIHPFTLTLQGRRRADRREWSGHSPVLVFHRQVTPLSLTCVYLEPMWNMQCLDLLRFASHPILLCPIPGLPLVRCRALQDEAGMSLPAPWAMDLHFFQGTVSWGQTANFGRC